MAICTKCKKDHAVKNEGPLTICERKAYFKQGAKSNHSDKNGPIYSFGAGNRFQFPGAK